MRKIPRQARAEATVEAVLEAAAQLLVSQGYDQTSTNQIAEHAGMSIGSLYEYFPGKEAVFAEIRRRQSKKHYALLTKEPLPITPRQMLRHLVATHIEHVSSNVPLHVALQTEVPRLATANTEAEILDDYALRSVVFLDEHRDKLRPNAETDFIAEFLMRVLTSTINDYAVHAPLRLQEARLAQQVVDVLERYLLSDAL
ncbi:MAG: TetR/AcrR family transcriptional regulator [Pseudomonadota bacterium]